MHDDGVKERRQAAKDANSPFLSGHPRVWIHDQRRHRRLAAALVEARTGALSWLSYQANQVWQQAVGYASH